MKNIAIVSTCLYGGGAERIAGLLSKELAKVYNVYLFLFDVKNIVYEYGGTIVDLSEHGLEYEDEIRKQKKKYKIDVAISFMEPINFTNIRTRVDERVIISERCVQSLQNPFNVAEEMQIKRYYNYADEMIACSWGVKYEQEEYYNIKLPITTIYNFINKDLIRQKAKQNMEKDIELFLNNADYFVNVGRLNEQKQQEELIRQFAYFNKNIDSSKKMLIIGNGERKEELEVLIVKNNLTDKVRIVSYDKNPFRYIKQSIGVLVTSRYEGLPNVILEAMTIGCPVIAYDCLSGPRELLDDNIDYTSAYRGVHVGKRGIIVENNTDGKQCYFAEAMNVLRNDEIRSALIKSGISYMRDYSNENLLKKWIEVIERENSIKKLSADLEKNMMDVSPKYIYGAGEMGKYCFEVLSKQYKIDGFVVTKRENAHTFIHGVPVYELHEIKDCNATFIIGVSNVYQNAVVKNLQQYGCNNIVFNITGIL